MKEKINQYLEQTPMINTHSHQSSSEQYQNINLIEILKRNYCSWVHEIPDNMEELGAYLLRFSANTYLYWLSNSLEKLYGYKLNSENLKILDEKIKDFHKDTSAHLDILKNHCNFEKIILDCDFAPGKDNDHPELYQPALRYNMFCVCNTKHTLDCNGHNSFEYMKWDFKTFEEYLSAVLKHVEKFKSIKFAVAYDYGNDITDFDFDMAKSAYKNENTSEQEIKCFYDYMIYAICQMAEEKDITVQIHAGLGKMNKTAPMYLKPLIEAFPTAKFVILHGGYPWTDDMLGMFHVYKNIYLDLSWMPIISTENAKQFLREALELGDSHRIVIGCDTVTAEDEYGAVLAAREVISSVLADLVTENKIDEEQALYIAKKIWSENARNIFKV